MKMDSIESIRLLPGLSGMTNWLLFNTCTNPGISPLGDTSQYPSLSEVDKTKKGDFEIKSLQWESIMEIVLFFTSSLGNPIKDRSSSSVRMVSLKVFFFNVPNSPFVYSVIV